MRRGTGVIGGELQTLESAGRLRLRVFVIPDLPEALPQLCSVNYLTSITEPPKDRSTWWRNHNLRAMMSSIEAKHADRRNTLTRAEVATFPSAFFYAKQKL
jgi:hypothetical protein